jgi:hypothetical protein
MYKNDYNQMIANMVREQEKQFIANDIYQNGLPMIGGHVNSAHNTIEQNKDIEELNKTEGLGISGGAYGGVGGEGKATFKDYGFEPTMGAKPKYDMRGKLEGNGKKRGRPKGGGVSGGAMDKEAKAKANRMMGAGEKKKVVDTSAVKEVVKELKAVGAGISGGKKRGRPKKGGVITQLQVGNGMSGGKSLKDMVNKGLAKMKDVKKGGDIFSDISHAVETVAPFIEMAGAGKDEKKPKKEKKVKGKGSSGGFMARATIDRSNLPSSSMSGGKKTNKWFDHVAKVRAEHKGKAQKEIMKIAKETYKK